MGFFSKRKLNRGEEITFDYKYERYGHEAQKCYCNSSNCRGWLGGEPGKEREAAAPDEEEEEEEDDDYWSSSSEEEPSLKPIRPVAAPSLPPPAPTTSSSSSYYITPPTAPPFRKEKPKMKKRRRVRKSPRKIKNYEDDEEEEEIERFKTSGIRNQKHTVELCRLMVRTTDLNTRISLTRLVEAADVPCRRLFLDYRGLNIMHSWMSQLGWTPKELDLKIAIEEALSKLNIPHRTMLTESKVWQVVNRWSNATPENDDDIAAAASETPSRAESPVGGSNCDTSRQSSPPQTPLQSTPLASADVTPVPAEKMTPAAAANHVEDGEAAKEEAVEKVAEQILRSRTPTPPPPGEDDFMDAYVPIPPSSPAVPEENQHSIQVTTTTTSSEETVEKEVVDEFTFVEESEHKQQQQQPSIIRPPEDVAAAVQEAMNAIVDQLSRQDVDDSSEAHNTCERMDESTAAELEPTAKADASAAQEKAEVEEKVKVVQSKATQLLEMWKLLKEVFKIPKRELVKLRAEHEREADRAAARSHLIPPSPSSQLPPKGVHSIKPFYSGYYERRPQSPTNAKRERRVSRFDDQSGLLHKPGPLSREHRRQLFALKATTEEEEKKKRQLLVQQHMNKCYYLRLDPSVTPLFPQYPEYYFEHMTGEWTQMPDPAPQVKVSWQFPQMASLPLDAFKEDDPPLEDPAYYYPPGVVPVSYLYGPPAEDNPGCGDEQDPSHPNHVPFLSSEAADEIPFLGTEAGPPVTLEFDVSKVQQQPDIDDVLRRPSDLPPTANLVSTSSSTSAAVQTRQFSVRLPPRWKFARDAQGRTYYYNTVTKATQWEPPAAADEVSGETELLEDDGDVEMVEIETASTDDNEDEDDDNDDGDTDDEDEDEEEDAAKRDAEIEILASDLSAQEKELLLAKKKKTKEERQHERRQKRERDREKREYERKRRRERHGKHRKDGLVQEHLIPVSFPSNLVTRPV